MNKLRMAAIPALMILLAFTLFTACSSPAATPAPTPEPTTPEFDADGKSDAISEATIAYSQFYDLVNQALTKAKAK